MAERWRAAAALETKAAEQLELNAGHRATGQRLTASWRAVDRARAMRTATLMQVGAQARRTTREGAAAIGEAVAGQGARGIARGSFAPQAAREISRATSESLAVLRARGTADVIGTFIDEHRAVGDIFEMRGRLAAKTHRDAALQGEMGAVRSQQQQLRYGIYNLYESRMHASRTRRTAIGVRQGAARFERGAVDLKRQQAVFAREKEADAIYAARMSTDHEYSRAMSQRERSALEYERHEATRRKAVAEKEWVKYVLDNPPGIMEERPSESPLAAGLGLLGAVLL